jgi:pimeloyl-ACP methyl ester carboxylesterase
VPLLTPNLAPDGDEFTVTSALNALDAAVKEAEVANPDKQIRLIASSMGAYVAAVYASRDVNAGRIDRMMLLAPVFKPESVLDSLSAELGVEFTDAFREDLVNHDEYPFVQCSAYVVHGYDDEAAPLDNSLTWVRDASVNMRMGATGKEGIEVGERRLLEVAGMGHGIENALPQIKSKIITFFKLPFVIPEGLE